VGHIVKRAKNKKIIDAKVVKLVMRMAKEILKKPNVR
jgi:hypothetical protein